VPIGTNGVAPIGPFSPEVSSGSASISGLASGAVVSSPPGNGSAHSFSANNWLAGSEFGFQVSTLAFDNITVSYDQTSSNTGPGKYNFEYSVDGGAPVIVSPNYTVLANASPNTAWSSGGVRQSNFTFTCDLSADLDLDNATTVDFLILDAGTTSANGGTVAPAGTDRIDNFTVTATAVPEPTTLALSGFGGLFSMFVLRRKR
jgi:PEP-CTERM motif